MIDNGIKAIFLKGFKCTFIRNEMQYKIKIRLFRVLSIFLLKKKQMPGHLALKLVLGCCFC